MGQRSRRPCRKNRFGDVLPAQLTAALERQLLHVLGRRSAPRYRRTGSTDGARGESLAWRAMRPIRAVGNEPMQRPWRRRHGRLVGRGHPPATSSRRGRGTCDEAPGYTPIEATLPSHVRTRVGSSSAVHAHPTSTWSRALHGPCRRRSLRSSRGQCGLWPGDDTTCGSTAVATLVASSRRASAREASADRTPTSRNAVSPSDATASRCVRPDTMRESSLSRTLGDAPQVVLLPAPPPSGTRRHADRAPGARSIRTRRLA
jgi:hypothetical protein